MDEDISPLRPKPAAGVRCRRFQNVARGAAHIVTRLGTGPDMLQQNSVTGIIFARKVKQQLGDAVGEMEGMPCRLERRPGPLAVTRFVRSARDPWEETAAAASKSFASERPTASYGFEENSTCARRREGRTAWGEQYHRRVEEISRRRHLLDGLGGRKAT